MEGNRIAARGSQAFPRRYRLGDNKNYRFVYRRGKSVPSRNIVLVHLKGRDLKIGFSDYVDQLSALGAQKNLVIHTMHEDIFNTMHHI